jgi:hypothetical protein
MARFAPVWREVKVTEEYCPECHYPVLEAHGWLKRYPAIPVEGEPGAYTMEVPPDVCFCCHCPRQSVHPKESGRSWPKRSFKVLPTTTK